MCGIIGFVGNEDCVNYLLDGLSILENRGYDSAGVATLNAEGSMVVSKYASKSASSADAISRLREEAARHVGHGTGIGHTRWATHGAKTDTNAHPHTGRFGGHVHSPSSLRNARLTMRSSSE